MFGADSVSATQKLRIMLILEGSDEISLNAKLFNDSYRMGHDYLYMPEHDLRK